MGRRIFAAGVALAVTSVGGACAPDQGAERSAQESCGPASAPLGSDATAGESFPDVSLTDCDGLRGTLREVRCQHELTIVSIGAGWCAACIQETPSLQAAHEALHAEGIGVIQVIFQDAHALPATTAYCKTWVESYHLSLPVYVDPPGNTLGYFDANVAPLNLIVDRRGKVLWSEVGKVPDDLIALARSLRKP